MEVITHSSLSSRIVVLLYDKTATTWVLADKCTSL